MGCCGSCGGEETAPKKDQEQEQNQKQENEQTQAQSKESGQD